MSIRQTFATGFRWTSFAAVVNFVFAMAQIAVLARYLDKSDFAWVALAGIFVNTGVELQKSGINAAIVQRQETSVRTLSSLFWVNIGIGLLLFFIMLLFTPVLSFLYHNDILISICILYSSLLLIKAPSVQYKALLQKNLRFKELSIGEILGSTVGLICAIWLAVEGFGAYALVGGYISRYMVEGTSDIFFAKSHHQLLFLFDYQIVKPYLAFSSYHLLERVVTQIGSQMDLLIIGKVLGADALGVYDVFKRILVRPFNLINDTLEKIAFPVLSQLQAKLDEQKSLFFQLLSHLTTVNLFLIIALMIGAEPLIKYYLGESWVEYILIFRLICCFCIFHYLLNPVDVLLLAQGKIRQWFYANLFFVPVQALAIFIGGQYGLAGAAAANLLIFALFTATVYQMLILPNLAARCSTLWIFIKSPVLFTILAFLLSIPTLIFFNGMLGIFITLGVFALSYILLTLTWNKIFINTIQQLLNQ